MWGCGHHWDTQPKCITTEHLKVETSKDKEADQLLSTGESAAVKEPVIRKDCPWQMSKLTLAYSQTFPGNTELDLSLMMMSHGI